MATQVAPPLEIDAKELVPFIKDESVENPACGCTGGVPAFVLKHWLKK